MKKVAAIILLVMFLLCGCDPRSGQYPHQKAERWVSEDPMISLEYTHNEDGTWTFCEELYWNDELIAIEVAMQSDYFCVYPIDSTNPDVIHHEDRLFSGTWRYRQGNLILMIEEDYIFDGQYSQIVITPIK